MTASGERGLGRLPEGRKGCHGSITIYASGANGNVAPVAQIVGSATGLRDPSAVAVDSAGAIWVSDPTALGLFKFASGANGDVAPLQTIQGPATLLSDPQKIGIH